MLRTFFCQTNRHRNENLTDPITANGVRWRRQYPLLNGSGFHLSVTRTEQRTKNCRPQCGLNNPFFRYPQRAWLANRLGTPIQDDIY